MSIKEVKYILKEEGKLEQEYLKNLKTNLNKRQKYFMTGGGQVWDIPLERYLKERGWKLKEHKTDVKQITGQSCIKQKEKIIGKVKIVLNKRQLDKVEEGDIIVAPMTMPEYLPALSKVKAIITNEGGITSHAAIVARELRKPCIVGTKIATQVLKDGDLVEVDATKGIVTILRKS